MSGDELKAFLLANISNYPDFALIEDLTPFALSQIRKYNRSARNQTKGSQEISVIEKDLGEKTSFQNILTSEQISFICQHVRTKLAKYENVITSTSDLSCF